MINTSLAHSTRTIFFVKAVAIGDARAAPRRAIDKSRSSALAFKRIARPNSLNGV